MENFIKGRNEEKLNLIARLKREVPVTEKQFIQALDDAVEECEQGQHTAATIQNIYTMRDKIRTYNEKGIKLSYYYDEKLGSVSMYTVN
jgi:hypothetical protein